MLVGPIFSREMAMAPRRERYYVYRALYPAGLLLLVCTSWLMLAGAQIVTNIGDMARFGSMVFQILAPLQLTFVVFFSAISAAGSVALEKDRRTLILLMMTELSNSELVLGKLFSSLLNIVVMLMAGFPIFALVLLFGGVSSDQLLRTFAVTVMAAFTAGAIGNAVGFWRDKTFQTLAMTILGIVIWFVFGETLASMTSRIQFLGRNIQDDLACVGPLSAVLAASQSTAIVDQRASDALMIHLTASGGLASLITGLTVLLVRRWNPSREIRSRVSAMDVDSPTGVDPSRNAEQIEKARRAHVDSRLRSRGPLENSRRVWDNPVLWRETRTRAYGRKIVLIRATYLALFAATGYALYQMLFRGWVDNTGNPGTKIPDEVLILGPFFVISLVVVNALAVTSITSERDTRSLDLLLVTDLSPKEFLFGKLGGVFWVTKEMVVLPIVICLCLRWANAIDLEGLLFLIIGLLVMTCFAATLGIHCGMAYANSRTAIGVSLGTIFFLCLGVVTCILMMISFSGSFQMQLAPFLAFILGGCVGLYVALGIRNPSSAIGLASLVVPFATFYAVVSFLLENTGFTFLVTVSAYGFSTAAMIVPALYEFDFAMGRTVAAEE